MLLVALVTFNAIVDATKLTYSNINGKIYVETDSRHYAMHGQVLDQDGVRIVSVNGDSYSYLTSKCSLKCEILSDAHENQLRNYARFRKINLSVKQKSPAISNIPTSAYIWSDNFSAGEKEHSVIRLDKNTVVYSSEYFPGFLARVIISGEVVIFIQYDGVVGMRSLVCLSPSEKNLIVGIKKINTGDGISSYFSSKGDKAFKKYLQAHPLDVEELISEQKF